MVKDELSNSPLEGVSVFNNSQELIAQTNYTGKLTLPENVGDTLTLILNDFQSKEIYPHKLSIKELNRVYLKTEIFKLNTVIISGSKWSSKPNKTPEHIFSFTEKDIHFNNKSTSADLLNASGEVFIQKSQLGGGSPMIRGFAANRLLIVVDGIRMNNAIFRSGNIQNVIAIDPFTLNNVDVITGPGSVLYGSDAIGGVMNFETETIHPTEKLEFSGNIETRYATAAEEKTVHANAIVSHKKWASYTSFSITDFGDLKMGKNGSEDYLRPEFVESINHQDFIVENPNPIVQKQTAYYQKNVMQKFKFQPNAKWNLNYTFSWAETSDVPRYDRLTRYRDGNLRSAEWYYGPQKWILNALTAEFKTKNRFFDSYKSILSHQYFNESRHDRDLFSNITTQRFERVNVLSWDNNFKKKINEKNEFLYGVDVNLNHVNSYGKYENILTGETTKAASRYPDGSEWNQFGIYAKWLRELSNTINIESGLRYSYVNSVASFSDEFYPFPFHNADFSTGALSGNLGATFNVTNDFKLNLNFATGFRAPNIDDIAKVFDSEPGSVVVPNPHLNPEYIYSFETGISKSFGKFIYLNVNAYYSWLTDALVRRNFTLNDQSHILYDGEMSQVQAVQNAAGATVYGGIFSVEMNLHPNLKFLGKINYTEGKEELNDGAKSPLRHAAPLFGEMSLIYERKFIKFNLQSLFNGKIKAEDMPPSERSKSYLYALNSSGLPYVPSWVILNAKTQVQLSDYLYLNIGLENIFDKRYRPYSSGISAPGRNFVISVRTLF